MAPRRKPWRGEASAYFNPEVESINIAAIMDYPESSAYRSFGQRLGLASHKIGRETVKYFNRETQASVLVRRIPRQDINDIIEGGRLRVNVDRAYDDRRHRSARDRYFRVPITMQAGQSAGEFGGQLERQIIGGLREQRRAKPGSHWQDGDSDIENYDIIKMDDIYYRDVHRGRINDDVPELDYFEEYLLSDMEDEELLSGNHQFQKCYLEQFGIKRLVLREYTCIYESLMVILYYERNGKEPNISMNDWREYVLVHFNSEDWETQQMFFDQMIMECIRYFKKQYDIDVGLFNAHRCEQEMEKILRLEENGGTQYKYFLVYWSEHVFPALRIKLQEIINNQKTYLKRSNRSGKMFIMVPSCYNILYNEYICSLFGVGATPSGHYVHQELKSIPRLDLLTAGYILKGKQMYSHIEQCRALWEKNDIMTMTEEEIIASIMKRHDKATPESMEALLEILKARSGNLVFIPQELEHYKKLVEYRNDNIQSIAIEEIPLFEQQLNETSRIYKEVTRRNSQFLLQGLAVIDIETYMDNDTESSKSVYNMVPYCISLVGRLQQHYIENQEFVVKGLTQNKQVQKVRLCNVKHLFMGYHPKECVTKLIDFLMDGGYCHVQGSYSELDPVRPSVVQKQLYNYIFAHNGFGFDFRFLYEELHSKMREFHLVGDLTNTKHIRGNGLFFYDFSLIYKESLKTLGKTFFPDNEDLQKKECNLIIDLDKSTLKQWYMDCAQRGIRPREHEQLGEIMEYCLRDSEVLYQMVNKFFHKVYTTPFGHSFLPKMFFHSLSAIAYTMFSTCYLQKPIYVNKEVLAIEKQTKMGGCTGANSNYFGIGAFIDENSFYPAVMKNEMPVEYEMPLDNPYEALEEPMIITAAEIDKLSNVNIYRVTFKFPQDTMLPTISQKTKDTLVMVLESVGYDKYNKSNEAAAIYIFGYAMIAALQDIAGTEFKVFGMIRYKKGDFIFKDFIDDQYNARLEAKKNGDKVGDMFHKNIMNSAQGKLGQKGYENVRFGSIAFVRDMLAHLKLDDDNVHITIKQILTNSVDLFELRWVNRNDENMSTGNTVRIPSYIMSVARTQLLRIQNKIADAYANVDVIAYYDTDSILTRFDITNRDVDMKIQTVFDSYLSIDKRDLHDNLIGRALVLKLKTRITIWIAETIDSTEEMKILKNIKIQDVTELHKDSQTPLLDELRLGACKIEKYVIRGIALGAKQYGVYYIEKGGKGWEMKVAVKLKGVRSDARTMDILEKIHSNIGVDISNVDDIDIGAMPLFLTREMTKWSRMGAGTILTKMRKIVRPTLTKRLHDVITGTSLPFKDIDSFQKHKDEYEAKNMKMKKKFKTVEEKLFDDLQALPQYKKMQEAMQLQNQLRSSAKDYLKESIKTLTESRKRYMMRLPKIKYDHLQDRVFQLFVDDIELMNLASLYFPKIMMLAYQAIIRKRAATKKGINDMQDGKMSVKNSARVITYTLFIYYIMKEVKKFQDIPKNFQDVAVHLSRSIIGDLLVGQMQASREKVSRSVHIHKWNYSIVYAFEFLQAGVCIFQNESQKEFISNELPSDIGAPLEHRMKYSSLWQLLNNMQDTLIQMSDLSNYVEGVIDTTKLEEHQMIYKDENLQLKGQEFMQSLLVTTFHPREDDVNKQATVHTYDLLDQVVETDQLGDQLRVGMKRTSRQADLEDFDKYFLPRTLRDQIRKFPQIKIDEDFIRDTEVFDKEQYTVIQSKVASVLFMSSVIQNPQQSVKNININSVFDILKQVYGVSTFSKEFLHSLFYFDTKPSAPQKAELQDMMDIVLLFLFLFKGGRDASVIMTSLRKKIEQYTERKYPQEKFQKVCSIIFCRPDMFKAFGMKRLSEKTNNLFKALTSITIEFDGLMYPDEGTFNAHLSCIMDDRSKVPEKLFVLLQHIKDNEKLQEIGILLYNQIIRWRKPSKEMLKVLMGILLIESDVWGDNNRDTELLFEQQLQRGINNEELYEKFNDVDMDDSQCIDEQPLLHQQQFHDYQFRFLDDILENDIYHVHTFENQFNEQTLSFFKDKDPFYDNVFYNNADYDALDNARMQADVDSIDQDDFYRYITGKQKEDFIDMNDIVTDSFGRDQKPALKSKFFEWEAEEASGDEESEKPELIDTFKY